jgi:acetoin utilization deacetylase AcuC-like enzyme
MTTAFVTDPTHVAHRAPNHPERPERLDAIVAQLEARGLRGRMTAIAPREATDAELLRVHRQSLLDAVARASARGAWLDPDTYTTLESVGIARRAAGGLLAAVEAVLAGEAANAFVAMRPPGHHATPTRPMGFCLYNSIAVAAAAALEAGVERIAILDWDVHHGNGTQDAFWDDPRVLYVSTHASPFYPGTGGLGEVGGAAAAGTKINIPLPHGTGDPGFVAAYEQVALLALERHRPDLVLVSSGWDAHARDPLGTLQVTTAGYTRVAQLAVEAAQALCGGRIVATLEGGYDTHALAWCASGLVEVLLGDEPTADPEPGDVAAGDGLERVIAEVRRRVGL